MGIFDLFKPSAFTIARVSIQFPDDFETSSSVAILVEGTIPHGMEIWVWDLYYAKTLFNLGRCKVADGMKAQLESWAEEWVTVLMSGLPLPPEAFMLDSDLVLSAKPISRAEAYGIDVLARDRSWPTIQTHLPSRAFQNRTAYSALALAQYLIDRDRRYFARDLPVHVLAMRNYYSDVKPYTQFASILGAPTQAINSALELFKDLSKSGK